MKPSLTPSPSPPQWGGEGRGEVGKSPAPREAWWLRHLAILCLTATLTAGCVNQLAQREARLNLFIGQPESLLIQSLGVPDKSIETGGVKYLAYNERRLDVIPGSPSFFPGPWPYSWYGPYGPAFPPQIIDLQCETTFAVTAGIVRSYTLRGNACG